MLAADYHLKRVGVVGIVSVETYNSMTDAGFTLTNLTTPTEIERPRLVLIRGGRWSA